MHRLRTLDFRRSCIVVFFLLLISGRLTAQTRSVLDFATGGEYEDYLRILQLTEAQVFYPWSIRGLSPRVVDRFAQADSTGPWNLHQSYATSRLVVGPATTSVIVNSSYPYGANDGPVWAGRGITAVGSLSFALRAGPLSVSLAPKGFITTNNSFPLLVNKQAGDIGFRNGSFPEFVDLPQRFGGSSYGRLDPDASSIRLDTRFLSAGVSTANEWIGPATEFPFLLSNNAPGFAHVFVQTGEPINVWFAQLHGRVFWGKLDQSAYSPVQGSTRYVSLAQSGTTRLATSAQFVLLPRHIPGLEIGFGRFFHVPYTAVEPSRNFWTKPFKLFFTKNEFAQGDTLGADNQLASAFFRWVFPHSGFELYGERGYEDQFYDLREFFQDPDHEREYMLGFQKSLRKSGTQIDVLKAEIINYQLPTITRVRSEGLVYLHAILRQGHTNRGQLLGAYPGVGAAAASVLSWARYSPAGRTTFTLRRIVRNQSGDFLGSGEIATKGTDVIIAPGVDHMRFGRRIDFGWHVEAMQDINRDFQHDVPNLNLKLTARVHP